MPYSIGLTTPLSHFKAVLDYKDVDNPSHPRLYDPSTFLLAYLTTNWTLYLVPAVLGKPENDCPKLSLLYI
jgi:hypothetical protein